MPRPPAAPGGRYPPTGTAVRGTGRTGISFFLLLAQPNPRREGVMPRPPAAPTGSSSYSLRPNSFSISFNFNSIYVGRPWIHWPE